MNRIFCDVSGPESGMDEPLLICIACLHGNEPGGRKALERAAKQLEDTEGFSGRVVGLIGNISASAAAVRYVENDLNRLWTSDSVSNSGGSILELVKADELANERKELNELYASISKLLDSDPPGPRFILDLHSTSSVSAPFVPGAAPRSSLELAHVIRDLGLPQVVSTSDSVQGTLYAYYGEQGVPSLVIEGGEHQSVETEGALQHAIISVAASLGMLEAHTPLVAAARRALAESAPHVPKQLEIFYRHAIMPDDGFGMHPGFVNFQSVAAGQEIAADRHGPIRVPEDGYLLFPLYQTQGSDGFFLARATV